MGKIQAMPGRATRISGEKFRVRAFLLAIACISASILLAFDVSASPLAPLTSNELQKRLSDLQHVPWNGQYTKAGIDLGLPCDCSQIRLPVTDPQTGVTRVIKLQVILPRTARKVPAVIMIPTIEGTTVFEPALAGTFCFRGMATLVADINDNSLPDILPSWDLENQTMRDAVLALRTTIDFAQNHPSLHPDQIAMVGLSLGGIVTSLMAGIEPERLKATVVSVGGGNLPHVLATSTYPRISVLRHRRMKSVGMSNIVQYENTLQDVIKYDPLYFAHRANPDRVMMILAKRDSMVPYAAQKQLYDAFGNPSYILEPGGHIRTLFEMVLFHMPSIADFLDERFLQSDAELRAKALYAR